MQPANRRYSTGSHDSNDQDMAVPSTPGRRTLTAARYSGVTQLETDMEGFDARTEELRARLRELGADLDDAEARILAIDTCIEEAETDEELEEVVCEIDEIEEWFDAREEEEEEEEEDEEFYDAQTWGEPSEQEPPAPPPGRPIITPQDAAQVRLLEAHKKYLEMSRNKETLRTEYRVNRLWMAALKRWRRDPRIQQVRKDKKLAKANLDSEITASEDVLPGYQIMDTRSMVATVDRAEATYHRILREVAPISKAGVGSKTRFSFNISLGASLLGVAKSSIGLSYSGGVNIADDRRLRVTSTSGLTGKFEVGVRKVLEAAVSGELSRGTTEVFIDPEHWAANVAIRVQAIKNKLATANLTAQEMYGEEEAAELMRVHRIATHDPVVRVTGYSASLGGSAEAFDFGAEAGTSEKILVFERDTADGGKERRTAYESQQTFSVSRGGLSATFTRTKIENHANPDNDGNYCNFKLGLSGTAATNLESLTEEDKQAWQEEQEKKLREGLDASNDEEPAPGVQSHTGQGLGSGNLDEAKKELVGILDSAKTELKALVPAGLKFTLDLQRGHERTIEWNYLWNRPDAPRLQYSRTSKGSSQELSGSVEVGAAPATIGFGIGRDQSTMQSETLGTETMTYIQTVFNALRLRDKRDVDVGRTEEELVQWNAYMNAHRPEIWTLMGKIGDDRGLALEEIEAEAASARTYASEHQDDEPTVARAERVARTAHAFIVDCQGETTALEGIFDEHLFDRLTGRLTDYFEAAAKLAAVIQAGKWKPLT